MIRHEFDTAAGDRLALFIEEDGSLRLVQVWPSPREEEDLLPRQHAHALLALAADLVIELDGLREAIPALLDGARSRPEAVAPDGHAWLCGYSDALSEVQALAGGEGAEVSRET